VDIDELDIPENEDRLREQYEMSVEDERMMTIRRDERRARERERHTQEMERREQEEKRREEEKTRRQMEISEYSRFLAYPHSRSIYYTHPLTIDQQLIRRMQEEERWVQEDLRCIQENARWKAEEIRRKQEDQPRTRKQYIRHIRVKSKRYSETFHVKYTFQEWIQRLKRLEMDSYRSSTSKESV
jgi:hypothetical protein